MDNQGVQPQSNQGQAAPATGQPAAPASKVAPLSDSLAVSPAATSGGLSIPEPTPDYSAAPAQATSAPAPTPAPSPVAAGGDTGNLAELKQQALQQLSPLVSHLDQSPEERFRTTMMMIQASDNHGMIKDAYAAAQEIKDEKERAQALLDVVNEINYFTQKEE